MHSVLTNNSNAKSQQSLMNPGTCFEVVVVSFRRSDDLYVPIGPGGSSRGMGGYSALTEKRRQRQAIRCQQTKSPELGQIRISTCGVRRSLALHLSA